MASLPVLKARAKKQNARVRVLRVKARSAGTNKAAVEFDRAMKARDATVRAIAIKGVRR